MLIQIALALATAAPTQDDVLRGTVRGSVVSEPSGLPVQMAVVEVRTGGGTFTAIADPSGSYVLHKIPAGRSTLRVRHLEHAPLEMELLVPARGVVMLDLAMEHRPIVLPDVHVVSITGMADTVAAHRTDVAMLDVRAMEAAATPATVFSPGEGNGGGEGGGEEQFYVRGSAADLQLVLLDGAPIYAPFHMGGLIESFDPGVLRSARLYLGGAPARYDGGLSYVMDLTTRSPNHERHATSGALDMLAARGMVEGPLPGGAAYMVSGRGIHGAGLAHEGERFPYAYRDGLARLQAPLGRGASLSLTGFANAEAVRMDTAGVREDAGHWNNAAGSARLRGRVEGADAELTVAFGRYDALLPVRYRERDLQFTAGVERLRVTADFARPLGDVRMRYGAGHDRTWTLHEGHDLGAGTRTRNQSSGAVTGGYVEGTWQPDPKVVLRGGLRADVFSIDITGVVAPRFSLTWLVTESAALTLAGGRYHQYVRVPSRLTGTAPADTFAQAIRLPMDLAVAGASHLAVALDQELSDGLRMGLEGYYKAYTGLPSPVDGRAFSSGVDVWVRRGAGDVTGWIGYSLAWNWSLYTPVGSTQRFLGRQLLSAGFDAPVAGLASLGLRVAYGAGLPGTDFLTLDPASPETGLSGASSFTTPVDLDTDAPLAGWRHEPYLRLDAEVSRTWSPRLAGRTTRVTPYVRIVNALDRRDSLFYRYDDSVPGGTRGIGTLPVVPVAGLQWQF